MTLAELIAGLKDASEGRNQNCWPVCSFGGKDADLDAEGCTGISKVEQHWDTFVLTVGGHKTACPIERGDCGEKRRKRFNDILQDVIGETEWPSDWTGDDWSVSFTAQVPMDAHSTTVESALEAARVVVGVFEADMAALDAEFSRVWEEAVNRKIVPPVDGEERERAAAVSYHRIAARSGYDPLGLCPRAAAAARTGEVHRETLRRMVRFEARGVIRRLKAR